MPLQEKQATKGALLLGSKLPSKLLARSLGSLLLELIALSTAPN